LSFDTAALTAQQTFPEVKLVQEKPTPKPTPMTAALEVCKDTASTEGTYEFIVTGNNPSPEQFSLMPGDCQDVTIDSGNYMISEEDPFPGQDVSVTVTGECMLTSGTTTASGNIQAGEAQSCSFLNIVEEKKWENRHKHTSLSSWGATQMTKQAQKCNKCPSLKALEKLAQLERIYGTALHAHTETKIVNDKRVTSKKYVG